MLKDIKTSDIQKKLKIDFEDAFGFFLLKNVSKLYATNQIKLLTHLALSQDKGLTIHVPNACIISNSIKKLADKSIGKDGYSILNILTEID
ncbi:hypothetical protein COB57_05645 [Candidatus Peregrinibacteria bacterium]|nr:MAG: hypothetical protein COB57_05645 [Candidatus Peregrinibacteria bacterium]